MIKTKNSINKGDYCAIKRAILDSVSKQKESAYIQKRKFGNIKQKI